MMAPKTRWILYGLALGLTLLTIFHDGEDPARVLAVAQAIEAPPVDNRPVIAQAIPLDRLHRPSATPPSTDPFSARSWQQMDEEEERRNAPPAPPPKPQAPPLPYSYLGKMIEDGQTIIFLATRDRNYVARLGDTLDGVWRVDAIREQDMSFDYVPLKLKQNLSFMGGGGPAAAAQRATPKNEEEEETEQ